jgi:hypothetical protein
MTTATPRTCATCACSQAIAMKDGAVVDAKPQSNADMVDALGNPSVGLVCRRGPPSGRQVRTQRQVMMMKDGQPTPVTDRNGRPRLEEITEMQIGWQPTGPLACCFDGWRPEGTLPGDDWHKAGGSGADSAGV